VPQDGDLQRVQGRDRGKTCGCDPGTVGCFGLQPPAEAADSQGHHGPGHQGEAERVADEGCERWIETGKPGAERVYYAVTIHDALEYGGFDDTKIYGELCKPVGDRSIPSAQMLQAEAVEVWKKYKAKPDKVPY
jgi:hypothetical protein